jgi:predicted RNase H-like nuclease
VTPSIAVSPTLDGLSLTGVVGIDMPLGLLADGWRDADALARRALGRRGVTVFAIPPRLVWEQPTYAEANRTCRELTGKGLSAQTWGLRGKLLEADAYRRKSAAHLYEVHPELAFAALAGAPLQESKHTPPGLTVRRELLRQAGLTLPAKLSGAAENDLLDAVAVAWSARRIAAGHAVTLTNPAQRSDDNTEIAIRYLTTRPQPTGPPQPATPAHRATPACRATPGHPATPAHSATQPPRQRVPLGVLYDIVCRWRCYTTRMTHDHGSCPKCPAINR